MASSSKRMPFTVVYDPDALIDLESDVKGKDERKALSAQSTSSAASGRNCRHPMKALKGVGDLVELRPRQGHSPTRPLYRRFGDLYVILAIANKTTFEARVAAAQDRAKQYLD
jgi:hypothetical protein